MTGNIAILWPVVVQAALTLALYPVLLARRRSAVSSGAADLAAFRVTGAAEPDASATIARSIVNQFELPVLFYVVCLALLVTNGASWLAVVIAWIFALSRIVHAIVHIGSNRLRQRMPAWMVGYAAVAVLWAILAVHLLGIGAP